MNITYHKATINDKQLLIDYRLEFIVSLMGDQPQEAIDALKISLNTYISYAL